MLLLVEAHHAAAEKFSWRHGNREIAGRRQPGNGPGDLRRQIAGTSLRPVPPGGTPKSKDARWIDIHEDDQLDEAQMATWVKQAAALPGWVP